jgi:[acyl-carrier-protein] S-malonyltransferase
MKKTALLFSGQGAQVVGMGQDLFTGSPAARALYEQADASLGFSLSQISFTGPEPDLTKTDVCQPALYVHGLALLAYVREQQPSFTFQAAAGLSLGEYTAHAAAASFDFATGLKLVHIRGSLMQTACHATDGGMISLLGATPEVAARVAAEADLDVANFNGGGQIVLSGAKANIPQAEAAAKTHGVKRAIPLNVAGAYHSRLMAEAEAGLKPHLDSAPIKVPAVAVPANVTGALVREPAEIRATLARQVTGSVRWEECIQTLAAQGIEQFIELGPGAKLAGMLKRIVPDLPCHAVETIQQWKEKEHVIING